MKTGLSNLWHWLLGLLLLTAFTAHAADTDLFAGTLPGAGTPNVLFIIDSGASFSASNSSFRCHINLSTGAVNTTASSAPLGYVSAPLDQTNGGVEQCALYAVLKEMISTTAKVNVGFMFFNNKQQTFTPASGGTGTWGSECSSGVGGCLAMKVTPLNTTYGPAILNYIRQWNTTGNNDPYNIKAPANRGDGATYQEAWAYFNFKQGISGRTYTAADLPTQECGSNIIIWLGNNYNTQASPKDATNTAASPWLRLKGDASAPAAQLADPAADATTELQDLSDTLTTSCGNKTLDGTDEGKGGRALNWALYLKNYGISTISIAVQNPSTCDATYGAQMAKLGSPEIGGGGFSDTTNYEQLEDALKNAFGKVLAKNRAFAAVSLPVSVNTQGSYLNRVYIGMFRPANSFYPRWTGNLKQYRLGYKDSTKSRLELLDARPPAAGKYTSAVDSITGFIDGCAASYWTPQTTDTYWTFSQSGSCLGVTGSKASNFPDGEIVEKGGQAYVLRSITPSARTVKTCSPVFASCTTLTNFTTTNTAITDTLLGVPNGQVNTLIDWARGQNLANPDELNMGSSVMRGSAHGDVVHSRPVAVNHGTDEAPQIVVYYGANDGMLHAVNGNRNDPASVTVGQITSGGTTFNAGAELWSFMPPQFWGKIKRLYDNTIPVKYPDTISDTATAKDYGIDGPITALTGVSGTKTVIYASMRRGGRVIYAFDVTTPASPSLLWMVGCPNLTDDTGCTNVTNKDYRGIGQTWASLKSMTVSGQSSQLLIMGGGYDDCEDYDARAAGGANHNCTSSSKGKKIYVIDAADGTIMKAFDTDRGVIADVTLVREAGTNHVRYAYAADLGGNVYRLDFTASGTPATWTITKIASLGCDTLDACTANRKLMFAPSVVTDDGGYTYYVGVGSGDREKPVDWYTASKAVANAFFMIKDRPTEAAWIGDTTNCLTGATSLCKASLQEIDRNSTSTTVDPNKKGWYLTLESTEQVVTTAVTVYGTTYFSTHKPTSPNPSVCKIELGYTRLYSVDYKTANAASGESRFDHVSGDGLPPSPVAGQIKLDDGSVVPFCIGCDKDSPLQGKIPGVMSPITQPKNRLYWYIKK